MRFDFLNPIVQKAIQEPIQAVPTYMQDIVPAVPIKYKNWQEKRFHETGAYKEPEKWTWIDDDYYNLDNIKLGIQSAKKYGIPPSKYLGLLKQETRIGNIEGDNISRINLDAHWDRLLKEYPDLHYYDYTEIPSHILRPISADFGAKYLSELYKKTKDWDEAIQLYSGSGKLPYGGRVGTLKDKWYGKSLKDIIEEGGLHKGKYYSKKVKEQIEKLENSPIIKKMLEEKEY